jgi:hypothetical protein
MRRPRALFLSTLILPFFLGCSHGSGVAWVSASENMSPSRTYYSGESRNNSHRVRTNTDVPQHTKMRGERAVVTIGERELVVEFDQGRILIDNTAQAKLPPSTQDVEIRFTGGKLSDTADGSDVERP